MKSVILRANWIGLKAESTPGVTTPLKRISSAGGMIGVGDTDGVSVMVGVSVIVRVSVIVGVSVVVGVCVMVGVGGK